MLLVGLLLLEVLRWVAQVLPRPAIACTCLAAIGHLGRCLSIEASASLSAAALPAGPLAGTLHWVGRRPLLLLLLLRRLRCVLPVAPAAPVVPTTLWLLLLQLLVALLGDQSLQAEAELIIHARARHGTRCP